MGNIKKHILVISQYFYPEQFRINDICLEWVKRGYKVTVITGIPNYPEGTFYKGFGFFQNRMEKFNGVNIIRIPIIPRFFFLVVNYMSFVISGFFWSLFSKIDADLVFIFAVSPITQALPGIWYAKKRKKPCLIYVQDLWPESLQMVTGLKNKYIIKLFQKLSIYIYNNCDKVLTTSKSYINAISSLGVDKKRIFFWPQYAEDFYVPKISGGLDTNLFSIVFTGNIGKAQGLEILPYVAKKIKEINLQKPVRFQIVGDGSYKAELIELVKSLNVQNMFYFMHKQPAHLIPQILSSCNIAFLSFSDSPLLSMTIPAKLQSYLACGMPLLACVEGEVAQIINDANAGFCISPGKVDELALLISTISEMPSESLAKLGRNGLNYYLKNFQKASLLDEMDRYFAEY